MSLHFFSDQCVPSEITGILKRHDHRVTLLREILAVRSPDPIVIAKAQELDVLLLSLNGDFSDIVAYPPSAFGGIIAIQLHNHPEVIPLLMKGLLDFLSSNPERVLSRQTIHRGTASDSHS